MANGAWYQKTRLKWEQIISQNKGEKAHMVQGAHVKRIFKQSGVQIPIREGFSLIEKNKCLR